MQNFSKETALIAIIGMLTSREKLTQEKSIMLDRRLDSTTYNDKWEISRQNATALLRKLQKITNK